MRKNGRIFNSKLCLCFELKQTYLDVCSHASYRFSRPIYGRVAIFSFLALPTWHFLKVRVSKAVVIELISTTTDKSRRCINIYDDAKLLKDPYVTHYDARNRKLKYISLLDTN